MNKLTDPDYRLPIVNALRADKLFDEGTTAPLAIWGVDTITGERGQYVVKFKNSNRMTTTSSAFELIGAWMAMELELPVIEPALAIISSDFVEFAMKGQDGYRVAFQSQGINFASRYEPGYMNIPGFSFSLSHDHVETAKLIYVFDVFIGNTDRGHQRPNIALNGSKLMIYDHELAFSFLLLLPSLQSKTPWIFNESDRDLYEKHFFYKYLKELKPDLTQQVSLLQRFDEAFWKKVFSTLPSEWIDEKVRNIEPYLTSIIRNLSYFLESLNKTVTL